MSLREIKVVGTLECREDVAGHPGSRATVSKKWTLLADLHQCTDGPFTTVFREIPARTRAREGRSWGFSQRPAREHRKTRSTFYGTGVYVKTVVVIREKSPNCGDVLAIRRQTPLNPACAGAPWPPRGVGNERWGGSTLAPWLASATSSTGVLESQGVRVASWQRG